MNENLKNFIVDMRNFNVDNALDFLSEVTKYITGTWADLVSSPFTNDRHSIDLITYAIKNEHKPDIRNFGKDEYLFYVCYDIVSGSYKDYRVFTPDEFLKIISKKSDSRMKIIK